MSRNTFLQFALPDIDETEHAHVKESLDFGWITSGPKTKQFEAEFAAAVNAKHAVAVNSCTAAMHLALEAIGLQAGDEVITTPYTFAATAEVVRYFNAKPVFVDICSVDFNIRPDLIEAAITERTKAIIPIHIAGLAANLDAVGAIAAKHNLAVIEDAAHAFPSAYKGRKIGEPLLQSNIRHAICYSFYATKTLATGEGGMLCTNDETLADRARIMALHGMSKDAWMRYTDQGSWFYEIIAPGYKYNMTDIAAGLGLAQLAKSDRMWKQRKAIAEAYNNAFEPVKALQIPVTSAANRVTCGGCQSDCSALDGQHAWHLYMLRLNLDLLNINRAQFIQELKALKINTSVHFIPLHIHPYYRDTYGYQPDDFPITYREYMREISLPIYSKMSDRDVNDVIGAVLHVAEKYSRPVESEEPHSPDLALA